MPVRSLPNPARPAVARRLAGAGAAGVAAAFVLPAAAQAAAPPTPSSTAANPGQEGAETAPNAAAPTSPGVAPVYGFGKIRIGVQIKDGAYVPDGTTTAGSHLEITQTTQSGQSRTSTCTTDASTAESGSTITYCRFEGDTTYDAGPGNTVTIHQTGVSKDLVVDPETKTVPPCVIKVRPNAPIGCDETVILTDNGVPPKAEPDNATVSEGKSVDVDVLANDDTNGAPATLDVTQPEHGTARVLTSGGQAPNAHRAAAIAPDAGALVRYTPAAGYSGPDTFTYTVKTANGTATATVSAKVTAAPNTAPPSSPASTPPSTPPSSPASTPAPTTVPPTAAPSGSGGGSTLAATGTPTEQLAGVGLTLLIAGGGATVLARRRRHDRRHG